MRSASQAGVTEAKLLLTCRLCNTPEYSRFQIVLPFLASMHSTYRVAVSRLALNMNSLSPHSPGELCPSLPGRSIFELRSLSVQLAGIVLVSVSPVPLGPRKRVHSWAAAERQNAAVVSTNDKIANRRMGGTSNQAGSFGGERP